MTRFMCDEGEKLLGRKEHGVLCHGRTAPASLSALAISGRLSWVRE
uniref:Uncharacterized protein n=1 Tax=Arundo donax TaxID=35708 RepID=A0A0A9H216_ARUDO